MTWIVGGNYANGFYAGLAYTNQIQMAMAKNLELAFVYTGVNHSTNEHNISIFLSETLQEELDETKKKGKDE